MTHPTDTDLIRTLRDALQHLLHNIKSTGKRLDLGLAPTVARVAIAAADARLEQAPESDGKAQRVHALVNAGPCPGMSEAFDKHMGASCWTDPAYGPDASTWAAAWRAAKAAPAAGVPDGWQLVPKVPTFRMAVAAGDLADREWCYCITQNDAQKLWASMLHAAPQPGEQREGV